MGTHESSLFQVWPTREMQFWCKFFQNLHFEKNICYKLVDPHGSSNVTALGP